MPQLVSDWSCVCTSGTSVDGRPIEPQWLIDCANNYSRDTYTALLWPQHEEDISMRQYAYNLGEVDELKYEEENGVVKLYAKLIPNQFLIEANRMGQKLFTSVEIVPEFAGKYSNYLMGIAVTDIPASLGTQKLAFVFDGETVEGSRGNVEAFTLGKLSKRNNDGGKKTSFLGRLFTTGKTFSPEDNITDPPSEEDTGKMDELKALIEALTKRLDALEANANGEAAANTPEEAAEAVADLADEIADVAEEVAAAAEDVAANPEDEVKQEEFTAKKAKLAKLWQTFSAKTPAAKRMSRRQSRRQPAAPAGQESQDFSVMKSQLAALTERMTQLSSRATPLPSKTPAGKNQPFEFL
ncbi:GPO family capsid scaffolding protein [Serratia ureilytica]|uniref:GPO family capsid scaffolding protein n=1 Tax=Serratia ureilytica TaxID=300181 RepID=UPI0019D2E893|nr:GPO family capsid scaffolding protein [Serratia ureilytica]MBN5280236.1 GPO family capsid scaffolding protein [Serratia ureilytica]MBN5372034.1 GPO family capsid scaffolding protein [Serratia ureilytica]HEI9850085.1 GPO family capsid scaffolding protein [Serratia marcescens]